MRVLMVCLGNICRSPIAQGVLEKRAAEAGVEIEVDSAGTGGGHTGDPPDFRAVEAAERHGIDIGGQRARRVTADDFRRFDMICAMDDSNLDALREMAPADATAKLRRLLDFATDVDTAAVPDPFYGSRAGFERAVTLIEDGIGGLIDSLREGRSGG
jgi:protein-tyrosine phosphatase